MDDITKFITLCYSPLKVNIVAVDKRKHIVGVLTTSWLLSNDDKVMFRRLQKNLKEYEIHSIGVSNTVWRGDDVIEVNIYRKE